MSEYKKPKILSSGQKVALLSLSSPVAPGALDATIEFLKEKSLEVVLPFDPTEFYQRDDFGFSSQSVAVRCKALHECLKDPEVAAILNVRGGYGSMELLPKIDFDLFKKHPKIFVGFSDNTAILLAAERQSTSVVFHGPTARALTDQSLDEDGNVSARLMLKFLFGKCTNPFETVELQHVSGSAARTVKGRLIGGNLQILTNLIGTPWMPQLAGKILFIEETKEQPYRVHRSLVQLKLAGHFEKVKAVLLGDFRSCKHPYDLGPSVERVIRDFFAKEKFPVFDGLPSGHLGLNYPLPIGIETEVSKAGEISFCENIFA